MEALRGFMECEEYVNNVAPLRAGSGIYDIAVYEEAS
jgi:hypothetical protein